MLSGDTIADQYINANYINVSSTFIIYLFYQLVCLHFCLFVYHRDMMEQRRLTFVLKVCIIVDSSIYYQEFIREESI